MNIVGDSFLRASISQGGYFIKAILNARAVHFFPHTTEHRDATLPGLCYRDDSNGDALAATVQPTRIDIRLHSAYSPSQVKAIVDKIGMQIGDAADAQSFDVTYGGKHLTTIRLNR